MFIVLSKCLSGDKNKCVYGSSVTAVGIVHVHVLARCSALNYLHVPDVVNVEVLS